MADPSSDPTAPAPNSGASASVSPALEAARRRWMADTLQFHLDPITPPLSTPSPTLPPIPNFQLPDPAATFGAPQSVPPPALLPTPPGSSAASAGSAGPPSPTLTREGIEVEADGTRPLPKGPVQLFPSASMAVRTPWNGQPIGPDVRGPVTSAEVGVTVLQVGGEDLNAQLRASLERTPEGLSGHATVHLEAKLGPVHVEIEGDKTSEGEEGKIGIGGTF